MWLSTPLYLFRIVWKERNSRAFENEGHLVQGCKSFFLCNLWAWAKGFLDFGPPSFVDFCRLVKLCLKGSLTSFVYHLYTLGRFLDMPFYLFINILLFIHQKKKKKVIQDRG